MINSKPTQHTIPAFTLLEILIALSVIAILTAMSIPNWRSFIINQRTRGDVSRLEGLINTARTTALTTNAPVTITPKEGRDWSKGIVMRDNSGKILQTLPPIQTHANLHWRGFVSTHQLIFKPKLTHMAASGHFSYIPPAKKSEKRLILNRFARVRLS